MKSITKQIARNIKKLRENRGLLQKQVAAELDIGYSIYNKIENGQRTPSIDILYRLAKFYGISLDELVEMNGQVPQETKIEDEPTREQLRLLQQLDEDDREIVFEIINKMLTNKELKDFFEQKLAS
jgi:transcriptional regulator with XRE-family HTH domain